MSSADHHPIDVSNEKTANENKMAIDPLTTTTTTDTTSNPSSSSSLSMPNLTASESETASVNPAEKMDITPLPSPSTSIAATTLSSSSSSTPDAALIESINKIASHPKLSDSSLRHLHKLLLGIKKTPAALTNRKFRTDNIAVKKFIMDIEGAEGLLTLIGYQKIEKTEIGKTVQYLNLELDVAEKNMPIIEKTIDLLNQKIENNGTTSSTSSSTGSSSSSSSSSSASGTKASTAAAPTGPRTPCSGGCGFYGDPLNDNYCSVCYRKKLSMPTTASAKAQPGKCSKLCGNFGSEKFKGMCSSCWTKHQSSISALKKSWKRAFLKAKAVVRFAKGKKALQVNKNRCYQCSKKIGINGFECRCTFVFCARHRHPEEHGCTFDFKSIHKKKLEKDNKIVAASKIDKIDQ